MGTVKTNLERYLELWIIFEKEIRISNKLKSNNLSGFAKYYEKNSDSTTSNDYKKVYDKLKKMKQRKDVVKNIRENTLVELEEFYKFLKEDYFVQELLDDERPEHWYD
ncbi:MAG: site-specific recombinase XerD [Sulfurimonas sp.]|jgi:site-specific recombinase XerD